jgi:hypothetical protein
VKDKCWALFAVVNKNTERASLESMIKFYPIIFDRDENDNAEMLRVEINNWEISLITNNNVIVLSFCELIYLFN